MSGERTAGRMARAPRRILVTVGHGAQGDPATASDGCVKQPAAASSNPARVKRQKRWARKGWLKKGESEPTRFIEVYRAQLAAAEAAFEGGPLAGDALAAGQKIIEEVRRQREADQSRLGARNQPGLSQRRYPDDRVRDAGPRERALPSEVPQQPPAGRTRRPATSTKTQTQE